MFTVPLALMLAACTPDPCRCPPDTGGCTEDSGGCPDDSDLPGPEDTDETAAPPPLRVALYDDGASAYPSAWAEGLDAIEAAMRAYGADVERIDRDALNGEPGLLQGFSVLLFGGGYAYPGYTVYITGRGKARIQEFVAGGGAFVGICAGAYFACDSIDYEGATWGDESGYDTDLYPGACGGPVAEVSSYPVWAPATVDFPGHPSYEDFGNVPFERQIFYAGGPFFDAPPDGTEVLARYADPGPHQGLAAVVARAYGAGRVVLWGPHPEVLSVASVPDVTLDAANRDLYAGVVAWAAEP
jgi:biotin--protein ligase